MPNRAPRFHNVLFPFGRDPKGSAIVPRPRTVVAYLDHSPRVAGELARRIPLCHDYPSEKFDLTQHQKISACLSESPIERPLQVNR
jgi:hypothetical protein